ncbi:hypothetical protein SYNGFB01_10950 [Synechococcus sp. GFB01]|nr:hypothetical protein SYNGFB01_10950 [Synechococcus sp. GFB01]
MRTTSAIVLQPKVTAIDRFAGVCSEAQHESVACWSQHRLVLVIVDPHLPPKAQIGFSLGDQLSVSSFDHLLRQQHTMQPNADTARHHLNQSPAAGSARNGVKTIASLTTSPIAGEARGTNGPRESSAGKARPCRRASIGMTPGAGPDPERAGW